MNYVVADIHGEITKLKQLVSYIKTNDIAPQFIFIGDYVDKGEDAQATLDFLVDLSGKHTCVFLLGNHEYCWINASHYHEYLLKYGGRNTMLSFNCNSIADARLMMLEKYSAFFKTLISYYIIDDYFISHSGIDPEKYNIADLNTIEKEGFLFNRYPFIKKQSLFQNKYKVIFGHTGFFEPYVDNYKIGIDTAACYLPDQPLTCFCIEQKTFLNSDNKTYNIDNFVGDFCPNIIRSKPYRTL